MRVILFLIVILINSNSFAQNVNSTIRRGNDAYNNKKYKDAEIDYKTAIHL